MPFTTINVNYKTFKRKLLNAVENKGRPIARKKAYDLFYRAKRNMLREFNTHLITLELEAGPSYSSKNISGTLEGYGNLFSFLGFDSGDRPTERVRDILIQETTYISTPTFRNNRWIFKVNYPSRSQIVSETDGDLGRWNDGSWIDLVEKGAPGIIFYLNLKKSNASSASNYGFQTPWEINDDLSFSPKPYLTEILRKFRDRINNSEINE